MIDSILEEGKTSSTLLQDLQLIDMKRTEISSQR